MQPYQYREPFVAEIDGQMVKFVPVFGYETIRLEGFNVFSPVNSTKPEGQIDMPKFEQIIKQKNGQFRFISSWEEYKLNVMTLAQLQTELANIKAKADKYAAKRLEQFSKASERNKWKMSYSKEREYDNKISDLKQRIERKRKIELNKGKIEVLKLKLKFKLLGLK